MYLVTEVSQNITPVSIEPRTSTFLSELQKPVLVGRASYCHDPVVLNVKSSAWESERESQLSFNPLKPHFQLGFKVSFPFKFFQI